MMAQLRDVANIAMGQSPKGDRCFEFERGLPLLNGPTEFGSWHPIPTQWTDDPKRHALNGDLLFCVRGSTTGRMNWADQEYAIGRGLAAISHKAGQAYQPWLRGIIELQLPDLLASATGSTFPNVSKDQLHGLWIPDQSLPEQLEIASILGTLDDKIELNRRMSATLEDMARSLYRSWFVDFDPVHAKMDGRQPAFMDEATAALFPDRFGDDGLPEGWMCGNLSDIATNPRTGVKPDQVDPTTPYIGLEHMPKRCITLSEWGTAEDIGSQKSAIQQGDFLFGKLRPYFHKVGISPVSGICSTDIVVVRAAKPLWAAYTLSIISSDDFVEHTNAGSSGTRMPRTNWKDMGSYETVIPPEEVAQAFENMLAPTRTRIIEGVHEAKSLAALRDSLLPKLMSGEIRVGEAREHIEEVA